MFTAEYMKVSCYGTFSVTGKTADELIQKLEECGFNFKYDTRDKIRTWCKWCSETKKKCSGANLTVRCD